MQEIRGNTTNKSQKESGIAKEEGKAEKKWGRNYSLNVKTREKKINCPKCKKIKGKHIQSQVRTSLGKKNKCKI